jgi:choline dehydrogenase
MNTKKYACQFHTVAEEYLDNRVMHCPRGKVLGGSSSINGMVFVRGHRKDFDEWQEYGANGWSYDLHSSSKCNRIHFSLKYLIWRLPI